MKGLKRRKVAGWYLIEIGEDYFRLGIIQEEENKYCFRDFKSIYLENGIKDPSFWTIFEECFKKIYLQEIKKAYILISPGHIFTNAKVIPFIPKKEVRNYCNQVLMPEAGINPEEYYLDYRIKRLRGQNFLATMAGGVKKEILDKLIDTLSVFNIEIERIDTSGIAIESLFLGLELTPSGRSVLILRLEETFSELYILEENYLIHYRVLEFGFKAIRSSLIRTVYTQTTPVEIRNEEAEKILKNIGYTLEEGSYLGVSYHQIRILLSPPLEILSENINIFLQEYKKEFPGMKISNLYLIGRGAILKGLGEFLEDKLSLPTLYLDASSVFEEIKFEAKLLKEDLLSLPPLLGILYPSVKKYDFFPLHYKVIKETSRLKEKALIYVFILWAGLCFFYLGIKLSIFYLGKINAVAKQACSEIAPLVKRMELLEKFTQEVNVISDKVSEIYSQYPDWIGILKELSLLLPDEILIEKLESREKGKEKLLYLKGNVFSDIGSSNLILNQFIQTLEGVSYFKSVKLLNTEQVSSGYLKGVNFELICLLN